MSIAKRIKREARKSPAKAAVLVGLLGLALYSWAPIVWGWTAGRERPAKAVSPADNEGPERVAARPAAPGEADGEPERPSWKELKKWRQASPWTEPVELLALRDPFQPPGSETAAAEDEDEEPSPNSPEEILAGLGIQLTGTIVGPKRRVAILDGRAYRQGDTVRVEQPGMTLEVEIRKIEADRVTLGWHALERVLTAPERPSVGGIELVEHSD